MRTSTRQDWLAAAAILAGLAAIFAIPAATTGASAARAVAAMTISALIALAVARAPFTFALRVRTAFVLLVTLSLWYVLTRLWAVDPAGSMVESSRVSAFVLLAWAAHTCVVGVGARRALLAGLAAAGLFVSAEPLWNALRDGAPNVRVAGELGYWNATAIVALVLVPTAVALAGTGQRRFIALAGLLIPVAGVTAVASASRGALAALVVALLMQALLDPDHRGGLPRALVAGTSLGLVVFGLAIDGMPVLASLLGPALFAIGGFGLIRARRVRRERAQLTVVEAAETRTTPRRAPRAIQVAGAVLMLALAGLLVALVLDANEGDVPGRGTPPPTGDVTRLASTDDSDRIGWWREGVQMWQEAPLWGRGGGAFGALHVEGRGTSLGHVHSMPIEVLLETGLVGALLLATATILMLRVLRQGHRSTERALAGSIAALVLAQSLLDWTLSLPQVLVLLAVAGPLALVRPPADDAPDATPVSAPPIWQPLTMLAALAAATTVALTPMLAALLADQAATRFDAGDFEASASFAEQSMLLVPSIDTLTVQVISLQNDGQNAAAADVLRDTEQVWSRQLSGLKLAEPLLADDPQFGDMIRERTSDLEFRRDARTPGLN